MSGHPLTQSNGNPLPKMFVDANGCWIWTLAGNAQGYVQWMQRDENRNRHVHVVIWETFNGPVPNGAELDHLCRVRRCVNPAHLELVTHKINTLRGNNPMAINARKTHCARGHGFTPENTRRSWNKSQRYWERVCLACQRSKHARS